ncbi:MAG: hypothetical protein JWM73_1784, partial [Solirubrobacterales bacterium]|nr:hypothetical protein [Solirubrobacterales bacterium]
TTTTPPVATPPADDPNVHTPISLGVDVASVYDPYNSALDQTDPSDSYDENPKTVFTVTTDTADDMAVGLEFDLETPQDIQKVYFRTTTPGFTVEVYGAKDRLPPDILDNRWHMLASRKAAGTAKGSDGLVKLQFDPGKYRHVVLWFTKPAPAAADPGQPAPESTTVGISEVRILD